MKNRKTIYYTLGLISLLCFVLLAIILHIKSLAISVVFFDVGQGDSILISQGSQQVLIDGGKDGKVLLEKLGKYVPFWDRNIELVIESHPDSDHIGGLVDLFNAYKIDNVMKTRMQSDSQTFKTLDDTIKNAKSNVIEARSGEKLIFASGAEAEVVFPFDSIADVNNSDTNAASVVVRLSTGSSTFLFTGDLPIPQEEEIVGKNINVQADILKVGHHGSKYSSGNDFLDAVNPVNGIISVGKDNVYGHPNAEALQRLLAHKINIFRTDEMGDIEYDCPSQDTKCQMRK